MSDVEPEKQRITEDSRTTSFAYTIGGVEMQMLDIPGDLVLSVEVEQNVVATPPGIIRRLQAGEADLDGSVFERGVRLDVPRVVNGEQLRTSTARIDEAKGEVVFTWSSKKKTLRIDRKTGILKSIKVVNFDDSVREIELKQFRPGGPFPEVARPEKWIDKGIPKEFLESEWVTHVSFMATGIGLILEKWDDLSAQGKEDDAFRLITHWAAASADYWCSVARPVTSLVARNVAQEARLSVPFRAHPYRRGGTEQSKGNQAEGGDSEEISQPREARRIRPRA